MRRKRYYETRFASPMVVSCVRGGWVRFRKALEEQAEPFTQIEVAKRYHMSCHVTMAALKAAVAHGCYRFVERDHEHAHLFVPTAYKGQATDLQRQMRRLDHDATDALWLLQKAYPGYQPGLPIYKQALDVQHRFHRGYWWLSEHGYLPATMGNIILTHPAFIAIIRTCFFGDDDLIAFLRVPPLLPSIERRVYQKRYHVVR